VAYPGEAQKFQAVVVRAYMGDAGSVNYDAPFKVESACRLTRAAVSHKDAMTGGDAVLTIFVNGVTTGQSITVTDDQGAGAVESFNISPAIDLAEGDDVAYRSNGGPSGGGWFYVDSELELSGDVGVTYCWAMLNDIKAEESATVVVPADGEVVAVMNTRVAAPQTGNAVMTIKHNGVATGNTLTFLAGTKDTSEIHRLAMPDRFNVSAGDSIEFASDGVPSAGSELMVTVVIKCSDFLSAGNPGIYFESMVEPLPGAPSTQTCCAMRRGVARGLAVAARTAFTGGPTTVTIFKNGVTTGKTLSMPSIAQYRSILVRHDDVYFDEGDKISYVPGDDGAAGECYGLVLMGK